MGCAGWIAVPSHRAGPRHLLRQDEPLRAVELSDREASVLVGQQMSVRCGHRLGLAALDVSIVGAIDEVMTEFGYEVAKVA